MNTSKILFINPPYEPIGVRESVSSVSITLSIAMLAGVALQHNKSVKILDLNLSSRWQDDLDAAIRDFSPDLVGITFTTPLVRVSNLIALRIRDLSKKPVVIIGGGAHATARPKETLEQTTLDAVAVGEAEISFGLFLQNSGFDGIPGWIYKQNGEIISNQPSPLIDDLDTLPYAAVHLFPTEKYIYPPLSTKANPVCLLETSRGCYARCTFCNKNIFGYKIRRKSSKRVVDEMEYILSLGFREIHLADDLFTADMQHALSVCREIIKRKLIFSWVPRSGIRVDRVTPELLETMRLAGCYHIPFGIESGNQEILDTIKKGITIKQIRDAVAMTKSVGLETTGYFMFGLPGETRDTVLQTIGLAADLNLDHVKFGVTIPLPGTPLFEQMYQENRLLTFDWEKYTYSTPPWEIYNHPSLDQQTLEEITFNSQKLMSVANQSLHQKTNYHPDNPDASC